MAHHTLNAALGDHFGLSCDGKAMGCFGAEKASPGCLILSKSALSSSTMYQLEEKPLIMASDKLIHAYTSYAASAAFGPKSTDCFDIAGSRSLDLSALLFSRGGYANAYNGKTLSISIQNCCSKEIPMEVEQYLTTKLDKEAILRKMPAKKVFVYCGTKVYYANCLAASCSSASKAGAGADIEPARVGASISSGKQRKTFKESETPFPIAFEYRKIGEVKRDKCALGGKGYKSGTSTMDDQSVAAFEQQLLRSVPSASWGKMEVQLLLLLVASLVIILGLARSKSEGPLFRWVLGLPQGRW